MSACGGVNIDQSLVLLLMGKSQFGEVGASLQMGLMPACCMDMQDNDLGMGLQLDCRFSLSLAGELRLNRAGRLAFSRDADDDDADAAEVGERQEEDDETVAAFEEQGVSSSGVTGGEVKRDEQLLLAPLL